MVAIETLMRRVTINTNTGTAKGAVVNESVSKSRGEWAASGLGLALVLLASTASAQSWIVTGVATTFDDKASLNRIKGYFPANEAEQAPQLKAGEWINSEPLSLKKLRGRVVVVDFWTLGCPNCRSTFPALKQFDERYRDQGLTLIGVHTPESDHEKDVKSVKSSVKKLGIKYPVLTDNDYETWKAYRAQAWPSILIIDKQGRIRYVHVGQGAYDEQERVINAFLAEPV